MDLNEHLEFLSDSELIEAAKWANVDLANAARDNPESEWHQACFAGAMIYAQEMQERGLRLVTVH